MRATIKPEAERTNLQQIYAYPTIHGPCTSSIQLNDSLFCATRTRILLPRRDHKAGICLIHFYPSWGYGALTFIGDGGVDISQEKVGFQ